MPKNSTNIVKRLTFFVFAAALFALIANQVVSAQVENNDIRIYSVFVNRGVNSATITWKTDPKVRSQLEYADTTGVWQKTPWSTDYLEDHSLTLLNLKGDETYLYRITAEDSNGEIKTKNDSFTTLSESVVGQSPTAVGDPTGGFSALLSPIPSPTPTFFPNVLGSQQNIQYIPIYPYYPLAYQGQNEPTQAPQPTQVPTSTPTPTPQTAIGFFANNNLMLVIGLVLGVVVAYLLHQLTRDEKPNKKSSYTNRSAVQDQPEKPVDPLPNTYQFNVSPQEQE